VTNTDPASESTKIKLVALNYYAIFCLSLQTIKLHIFFFKKITQYKPDINNTRTLTPTNVRTNPLLGNL